jgi:drug/metabolite transporter (DMT)-like permease
LTKTTRTWLAWIALLGCETVCQIALKLAGKATGAFDFSAGAFQLALSTPWLWLAIGCYVGAFLAWLTILRDLALSAAFAASAIVFVAVMFASWLVFGERISPLQLLGSVIIVGGILLLGTDKDAPATAVPPSPSTGQPASG